jgi:flagellar basal-body rod modification protein FlgD
MQVNTAQAAQAASPTAKTTNDLGSKDIFLQILVAQMQNQDPLKPQDAAQMSTQLAQFNMVEQQISTNGLLKELLAGSQGQKSDVASAASLIGHQVSAQSNQFSFDGITPQTFTINTAQDASTTTVEVINSAGLVVKTLHSGFLASGINNMSWNGATNSGATAAPGEYSLKITATDINGQSVASTTQITGQVKAVRLSPDGVFAEIGNTPVSMANIAKIY